MEFKNLLVTIDDEIAVVTINRPKVMNALSVETIKELGEAIQSLHENDSVRGIVITGSGEKAFVAGADISELHSLDEAGAHEYALRGQSVLSRIENGDKPVVAAINGFALGGGCELAMACHLRVASESARFGQPEIKLGVLPGFGGTQRLSRLIGSTRAMELCLTGDMLGAAEARELGLLNQVVAQEEVLAAATALLKKVTRLAPLAAGYIIKAINEGTEMSLDRGLKLEAELFGACARSHDWKEGTAAFLEKRAPEFKGE